MKQPKVKPCPDCGDKRYTVYHSLSRRCLRWFISCPRCGFCGGNTWTKRGAIRMWNKYSRTVGTYERRS